MLNFIALRQNGVHDTSRLERAETTRRAYALELSKFVDVEKKHTAGVNSLDLDVVEGRFLLSSGADGVIAIHELHNLTGVPKCTYPAVVTIERTHRNAHKFSAETVQWYPLDTGMFISSGMDKLLKVWDTNSLVIADEYQFSGQVYSHDMSMVATKHSLIAVASHSSKVRLIDLKSGSSTHTLKGHRKAAIAVKWSSREEFLLASGGEDSKLLLWDIRSAKGSMMTLDQHNGDSSADPQSVNTAHNGHVNGICFSPDGLHLLSFGTDNRMRLWNTATGQNTLVNYGQISNESKKHIKFTVSQNTQPELVFVPSDSNIEVFEMLMGINLTTLRGHYNQVNCIIMDSSTQELYSSANDRNILIWSPDTGTEETYEEYLHEKSPPRSKPNFLKRVGARADAWSSDEED